MDGRQASAEGPRGRAAAGPGGAPRAGRASGRTGTGCGSGARLGALVAARQAAPTPQLRRTRARSGRAAGSDEAADTRWRRLDVEREVLALSERREPAVGPVADDRPHAREIGEAVAQELPGRRDVVGTSGVRPSGERQAEDLDEQRPLRADRPATAATGPVERRPVAAALHRLRVDHDHRRERRAVVEEPHDHRQAGQRPGPDAVRTPAPPLGPDRRPGPVALGQVAPLTAGPGQEQDRLDHLVPGDLGRCTASTERVEQVGDQLPLLIGQHDRETHADQPGGRPCRLSWHNPRDLNANSRPQALSTSLQC